MLAAAAANLTPLGATASTAAFNAAATAAVDCSHKHMPGCVNTMGAGQHCGTAEAARSVKKPAV
jgi:hypothetical protein